MKYNFLTLLILMVLLPSCNSMNLHQPNSNIDQSVSRNPITEYNIYLKHLIQNDRVPHMTLSSDMPPDLDGPNGPKYIETKTLTIFDKHIRKEIVLNLLLDDSLFVINEDGSITSYSCACVPDVSIVLTDFSNNRKELKISYYKNGEINCNVLHSQVPLKSENAKRLYETFQDLGLLK